MQKVHSDNRPDKRGKSLSDRRLKNRKAALNGGERGSCAFALAGQILDASVMIRQLTDEVCPSCKSVCCINRHSQYTGEDLFFLSAIGESAELPTENLDPNAKCRFLGEKGCRLSMVSRPYRCTWYFCDALLDRMNEKGPKYYRNFVETLASITRKRLDLLTHFDHESGKTVTSGDDSRKRNIS